MSGLPVGAVIDDEMIVVNVERFQKTDSPVDVMAMTLLNGDRGCISVTALDGQMLLVLDADEACWVAAALVRAVDALLENGPA